ncbi:glutamate synthase alpha subunit domain protein [Methanotorris formicicus Mc-S-70]|uniref:Glutamate synthase alpha subunit domain protein n=1 Tax=Methanotorris formicicus Mc-S-70 TaxID=647171 RepID=H1L1F8_9EURY|nr:glutamate synthase alpha subunit domain protein [Methanotorris formicicus Mc-S-70]
MLAKVLSGKNTGAVLKGGCVIVKGNTGDFTGIEMKKGVIIVDGNAGKYLGAKKKGGLIYARDGSPIPPTKKYPLSEDDKKLLSKLGFFGEFYKFQ